MHFRALVLLLAVAVASCTHRAPPADPDAVPTDADYAATHVVMREVPVDGGVACDVWNPNRPRVRIAPTYLVADIGKPRVPMPKPGELRLTRLIQHYVHSQTLRFGIVNGDDYIVFDATNGPCTGSAPGYWVLNVPSCNTFYFPSSENSVLIPVPECWSPPRPWIVPRERAGVGKWPGTSS